MTLPELTAWLATQGIGTADTDLFYGFMPNSPDAAVCLYEYGGRPDPMNRVFGAAEVVREHPRIHFEVRGAPEDYDTPRLKANDAYRAMSRVMELTLSGVTYFTSTPLQPPFPLSKDANLRFVFAFNVELFKQVSTT